MDTVVGAAKTGQKEWIPAIAHSRGSVNCQESSYLNIPGVSLQGQPVQVSSAPKGGLVQLFHSLGTEERFIGIERCSTMERLRRGD